MLSIRYTPPHTVYNTLKKEPEKKTRHWRQYSPRTHMFVINPTPPAVHHQVEELQEKVGEYKRINSRLKLLAKLNVRATQSALRNSQGLLEILEDLYGDAAFEDENEKETTPE